MSRKCLLCEKGPKAGKLVAHSKKRVPTRFLPNLQKKKFKFGGKIYKGYICTRCIRTHKTDIVYL